jgi:hypothetical protein
MEIFVATLLMRSSANRPKHTFARLAWEAISSENQQLNYTQNRSKINNIDRRSLKPPAILPRDFDAGKLGRLSGLILAKEFSARGTQVCLQVALTSPPSGSPPHVRCRRGSRVTDRAPISGGEQHSHRWREQRRGLEGNVADAIASHAASLFRHGFQLALGPLLLVNQGSQLRGPDRRAPEGMRDRSASSRRRQRTAAAGNRRSGCLYEPSWCYSSKVGRHQ